MHPLSPQTCNSRCPSFAWPFSRSAVVPSRKLGVQQRRFELCMRMLLDKRLVCLSQPSTHQKQGSGSGMQRLCIASHVDRPCAASRARAACAC